MSMLKFRRGSYSQINKAPLDNGAVYIATDEKAMYVDTAEGRIRIGDFIRVASISEIPKPYSETAVYYVENANALLGYKKNEDGTGKWTQINGTEDLANRITAVEGTLATQSSDISTLKIDVAANKTAIGVASSEGVEATGLNKKIEDNAADIEALKTAIGMGGESGTEDLNSRLSQVESDIDTLEGTVEAQGNTINQHTTTIGEHATKLGELETALNNHKTEAGNTYATKTELNTVKSDLQAEIDTDVAAEKTRAEAAEKALDDSIKAVELVANSAVQNSVFEAFKTSNTADIGTAKNEAIGAAEDYTDGKIANEISRADGKYATKIELQATDGVVAGHTTTLNTLTGDANTVGSVAAAKKAADDAAILAGTKTTMTEVEAKDYATKAEAQSYANGKDAAISAAQDAANAAQADATQALADAKKANDAIGNTEGGLVKDIADNKTAVAAAQKAIDDYKTEHADDYTNEEIEGLVEAASGSASGALAAAQAAQKAADDAQDAADAAQETADNALPKSEFETFKTTNTDAIAEAKKAGTDAAQIAEANGEAISTLQTAVNTLNGDVSTDGSVAKAVADAKTELEGKITDEINAANAMNYVNGIAIGEDLPTMVPAGSTYVAKDALGIINNENVLPGDLLIATGEEDDVKVIDGKTISVISNPTWTVVHTGYDADLEQTITTTSDGKIQLTSAVGAANNGQIEFTSDGSAATVSVANNKVVIGIEWEDFE